MKKTNVSITDFNLHPKACFSVWLALSKLLYVGLGYILLLTDLYILNTIMYRDGRNALG